MRCADNVPAGVRQYAESLFHRLLDAEVCRQDAARDLEQAVKALESAMAAEDAARTAYHRALQRTGLTHEQM